MFSLKNIENLVLNLRPGSVYLKSSFRYGPSFFNSHFCLFSATFKMIVHWGSVGKSTPYFRRLASISALSGREEVAGRRAWEHCPGREEVGGLEEAVGDSRPGFFKKSAENSSLDFGGKKVYIRRAQHINFGHSHPPRKLPQNAALMNFPEFPGSAFSLAFLYSLRGSPEFPGISRHFPRQGFWGPQIAFSGEDEVDMLGSGEVYTKGVFSSENSSAPTGKNSREKEGKYIYTKEPSRCLWGTPSCSIGV